MGANQIRVIAICVFRCEDEILVAEEFDHVKETPFYRPLGGGVEPGELAIAAIQREILEELEESIHQVQLLGVLENLFEYEGKPGHEIVFVFDGQFVNPDITQQTILRGMDSGDHVIQARWRSLDSFDSYHRLVPEGLMQLLITQPN
ncbi:MULTISPECIES: NUDIX domain-containing protein [unclassified Leptolyngbya]|uniref:NUDIX hydrolase n=1 Tax=unclassified Leptolyngbya TaxID=2650499 RepID=UPI001686CEA7|nr:MULTISPECIES: NUDIX domain-containing protein [unclassified Leptolyngbya]MBD1910469.1 NUDIX domain-containing protein [Leptolyngbya sp. FACHB-8]MBD2153636.1 NUDIX domain-containing protein [Leptolyngbya sp. FACHB-16]